MTNWAEFSQSELTLHSPFQLEIWDTAGQERYKSLAPMYYRGAQAAVVVFDVTSRQSFEGAKNWVRLIVVSVVLVPLCVIIRLSGFQVVLCSVAPRSFHYSCYCR